MTQVSPLRLNLLRAGYLLLFAGLGVEIWPKIIHHQPSWELMHGVAACMLGALGALAAAGLRYPLKMLPLILFELAWKAIWLLFVALPLWAANRLDAATVETAAECLVAVILVAVVPWGYVFATYVVGKGDPWRDRGRTA